MGGMVGATWSWSGVNSVAALLRSGMKAKHKIKCVNNMVTAM